MREKLEKMAINVVYNFKKNCEFHIKKYKKWFFYKQNLIFQCSKLISLKNHFVIIKLFLKDLY